MPKGSILRRLQKLEEGYDASGLLVRISELERQVEALELLVTGAHPEDDMSDLDPPQSIFTYIITGRYYKKQIKKLDVPYYFRKHPIKTEGFKKWWTDDIEEAEMMSDSSTPNEIIESLEEEAAGMRDIEVIRVNENFEQV